MRILTTAQESAISASRRRMAYLVHARFPSGDVRFSTTAHTLFYANEEWLGGGALLDIQFAEEDGSLSARNAEITLDGLDVSTLSLALNEQTENAPITIYCALFDPDSNQPIGDFQLYRGTVSQIRILPPSSSES